MPDTSRTIALVMAAAAVILHVWVPDAAAGRESDGRDVTDHIVVGLTPATSFAVLVEDDEIPESPVTSSGLGIVEFSVDDSGFPAGPLVVRVQDVGQLSITGVEITEVTATSAVVRWSTDEPTNSLVEYGETPAYGSHSLLDPTLVTEHAVPLTGLSPGTTYHCRAVSEDAGGRVAVSSDREFITLVEPLEIMDVAVEDVGDTWAVVTWLTNRPADSRVEYGATPAYGEIAPLDPSLVTEHAVLISGLAPAATYHFRALSDDGQGFSAASGDHSFETVLEPLLVFDVRILDAGTTWVTVGWTTNRASDSLVEYGETTAYGQETPLDPEPVFDHASTLSDLLPGTLYHFRARSEDEWGEVAYSEDATVTTATVPLAVLGLAVVDVGPTWAVIEWETDRAASSFVLYGSTPDYGAVEELNQGFVTEHSATLAGLADGALYHFMAVSIDEDGVVGTSADSTFETPDAAPTGPPIVHGVSAVVRTATSVLVTWTTDRPATSQVRYGTGGELDRATAVDTVLVVEHGAVVEPVVPAIEYTFVVVSACGADTTVSGPRTFATPRPPGTDLSDREVTIVRPGLAALADTAAVVRWATDRACSTWVEWGPDSEYGSTRRGRRVSDHQYEAAIAGLVPETVYHYRVCARSEVGAVTVGDDRVFETPASPDGEPPGAPEGLRGTVVGCTVELEWTANQEDDLLGYFVYRARAGPDVGEWSREVRVNDSPVGETRFIDESVEPGGLYSYAATAVDRSWNESPASASVVLAVPDEALGPLSFTAFPNPSRAGTSFACSVPFEECLLELRIVSPSGRLVHEAREVASAGTRTLTWDGRDRGGALVGSGVYLCEIALAGTVVREKLTLLR